MFFRLGMILAALGALVMGCEDSELKSDPGDFIIECPAGVSPETGECVIGTLAPGENIDTPNSAFEAPTLIPDPIGFFMNQEGTGRFTLFASECPEGAMPNSRDCSHSERRIGVRVITYSGQPAAGQTVQFELIENNPERPSGVSIGSASSVSNDFGVASIKVRAGVNPSFVKLAMTSPDTPGLTYDINVVLRPTDVGIGPNPGGPDGGGRNCLRTKGIYDVTNRYEPGQVLGDDAFQTIERVGQALTDPGGLIGDMIRDRIGGIWGSVVRGAVRPVINSLFQQMVQNYLPGWAQRTIGITTDITTLLTELEVLGQIELSDEDRMTCELEGIHRWRTLVFLWRDGCPPNDDQCGRHEIRLEELGASASETPFTAEISQILGPVNTMEIHEHPMQLNIGVALIWFLQEVVLPQRFNVRSFGQLIEMVLPCQAVGQMAADYLRGVPLLGFAVAPFVTQACREAMDAAGNWVAEQLLGSLSQDAWDIAGECKLRDTTADRVVDKLEDGRWEGGLPGDFEGERPN